MSRAVLAGLLGRSTEWLKAVENGRLQPPRLPMLLRIAHALELADLAELTGNGHAVPVAVFAGERHGALTEVQAALTEYRSAAPARPANITHLEQRLRQAWTIRHASPDHRTQLGKLLPGLIRDAQGTVRAGGVNRPAARRMLAGGYQVADLLVSYQPPPRRGWVGGDSALCEGVVAAGSAGPSEGEVAA
ncbi:helix-turn-helix domain-containing protein [Nocardia cyriacigeorgica]|uniref:helix-turn-helix domain-containing protein n=1 Tax=Nocardia cyriacigeorgica TaxID=135487 RepID=UPI00245426CA|nr:helix-turn-helix domain-containing protein [Nocardia cyriacigeorgica]